MMVETAQGSYEPLEETLVQQFRLCQSLHNITRDERLALTKNDVSALARLAEQKETLLDRLSQVEERRRVTVQDVAHKAGLNLETPTIIDIIRILPPQQASRVANLREGILAISQEIRDLTGGNTALIKLGLERIDALQSFLLDLYRPTVTYQRPGAVNQSSLPELSLDVDHSL